MLASSTAAKWADRYSDNSWGQDKLDILKRLLALESNPEPDQVDSIIGNASWTATKCDECGTQGIEVVELGEEPDYESSTACICKDCLRRALSL
jgi:hypothetical protein